MALGKIYRVTYKKYDENGKEIVEDEAKSSDEKGIMGMKTEGEGDELLIKEKSDPGDLISQFKK